MRLQQKSLSRVALSDLLRRKKKTLKAFIDEHGIFTYSLLQARCESMGVKSPAEEEFIAARGRPETQNVSSPTEGLVVIQPVSEQSEVQPVPTEPLVEVFAPDPVASDAAPAEQPKPKKRKKSPDSSDDL